MLHNPERQLFEADYPSGHSPTASREVEEQVLELKPGLPLEVIQDIKEYAHQEIEVGEMTSAPVRLGDDTNKLYIDALVPMDDDELAAFQFGLNNAQKEVNENMSCVVCPWTAGRPAIRPRVLEVV